MVAPLSHHIKGKKLCDVPSTAPGAWQMLRRCSFPLPKLFLPVAHAAHWPPGGSQESIREPCPANPRALLEWVPPGRQLHLPGKSLRIDLSGKQFGAVAAGGEDRLGPVPWVHVGLNWRCASIIRIDSLINLLILSGVGFTLFLQKCVRCLFFHHFVSCSILDSRCPFSCALEGALFLQVNSCWGHGPSGSILLLTHHSASPGVCKRQVFNSFDAIPTFEQLFCARPRSMRCRRPVSNT